MTIILMTLLFCLAGRTQQCSQLLNLNKVSPISSALQLMRDRKSQVMSGIVVSGISIESLNTLEAYYKIVDPSRLVQDISNRDFYLIPFKEDRRLMSLPKSTKDKMLKLIESRLFKPLEALLVAKYITGTDDYKNTDQWAAELIKLRVNELVLLNLKKQLEKNNVQTNLRMKLSKDEQQQIQRYLRRDLRQGEYSLPLSFSEIDPYLKAVNAGSFVNVFIRRYLERIYFYL